MKRIIGVAVLVSIVFLTLPGFASTYSVNCNLSGAAGKISTYLKFLNPLGPNTLNIRGMCKENITINQFGRLFLIGISGATIQDASNGTQPVINITDSQAVYLQTLTIVGGSYGVLCFDGSNCRFSGNVIEKSAGTGVWINNSQATFAGDVMRDTGDPGLGIEASRATAGGITIQRSVGAGIHEANGSTFETFGMNVADNGGDGILVSDHSHMFAGDSTITNNAYNGIDISDQSEVELLQTTITGNNFNGISIGDSSLAEFGMGGTYTGNGLDIGCLGQYSVAANIQGSTYGTTSCPVPTAQTSATQRKGLRPQVIRPLSK
jgi:hypothetical protein